VVPFTAPAETSIAQNRSGGIRDLRGRLGEVSVTFREAVDDLDGASFQALYGPWDPMSPEEITGLLAGSGARWAIAGGRAARAPWRFEFLLDRLSTDEEWVYKRDARVRLPWDRAVHTVGGVEYLRPEVALLFKAKKDRPKDRADLLAARLDPAGREWLADTLGLLGHDEWAGLTRLTRHTATADFGAGATGVIDRD
jgi:hypothetical protein